MILTYADLIKARNLAWAEQVLGDLICECCGNDLERRDLGLTKRCRECS